MPIVHSEGTLPPRPKPLPLVLPLDSQPLFFPLRGAPLGLGLVAVNIESFLEESGGGVDFDADAIRVAAVTPLMTKALADVAALDGLPDYLVHRVSGRPLSTRRCSVAPRSGVVGLLLAPVAPDSPCARKGAVGLLPLRTAVQFSARIVEFPNRLLAFRSMSMER